MSDRTELLLMLLTAALIIAVFYFSYRENEEWNRFKTDHRCEEIAFIEGDTFNTIE